MGSVQGPDESAPLGSAGIDDGLIDALPFRQPNSLLISSLDEENPGIVRIGETDRRDQGPGTRGQLPGRTT